MVFCVFISNNGFFGAQAGFPFGLVSSFPRLVVSPVGACVCGLVSGVCCFWVWLLCGFCLCSSGWFMVSFFLFRVNLGGFKVTRVLIGGFCEGGLVSVWFIVGRFGPFLESSGGWFASGGYSEVFVLCELVVEDWFLFGSLYG